MLWVPATSPALVQVAVPVLPELNSGTEEHEPIDAPPSEKLTLPLGEMPVTVAVNVTLDPAGEGLSELARMVALPPAPTDWNNVGLVDPTLLASPAYTALMLRVPAASDDVEQDAVRVFPLPVRFTAAQPAIDDPSLAKLMLPVGAAPVTNTVKVTFTPTADGFGELTRLVDVVEVTRCVRPLLLDAEFPASPP